MGGGEANTEQSSLAVVGRMNLEVEAGVSGPVSGPEAGGLKPLCIQPLVSGSCLTCDFSSLPSGRPHGASRQTDTHHPGCPAGPWGKGTTLARALETLHGSLQSPELHSCIPAIESL